MTWKPPHSGASPLGGPWPEEGDRGTEANGPQDRLERVEQSLRSLRPRPPRLAFEDWEAILRAAAAEPAVTESAADSSFPTASPEGTLHRPIPMIVGSWTCGAVAGALAMFLLMTTLQPNRDRAEPVAGPRVVADTGDASDASDSGSASSEEDAADLQQATEARQEATEQPSQLRHPPRFDSEEALVAMLAAPLGIGSPSAVPGAATPRAGMLVRPTRNGFAIPSASSRLAGNGPGSGEPRSFGKAGSPSSAPFASSPGVTRQRLLEDLLGEGTLSTL